MAQINMRWDDDDVHRLDSLAQRLGMNRTDCLRDAFDQYERRYGQNDWRETVNSLMDLYGADAVLTVSNKWDDSGGIYEVVPHLEPGTVTLNGPIEPSSDPFWQHALTRWEVDSGDNVAVWLEPVSHLANPPKIAVGTMPRKPSAKLTVKLIDLLPDLTLRNRFADGTVEEVRITGQQALDLSAGKPLAYTAGSPRVRVEDDGTIVRQHDAR